MTKQSELFEHGGSSLGLYLDAPTWNGKRCAAIGDLKFETPEQGNALLQQVITRIKPDGFHALLGPMNGDTWHSYRAVIESDSSAPFMLEPMSGPQDLSCLKHAGFETVSHYHSTRAALQDTLASTPVNVDGISIGAWDGKNGDVLVDHIFALSKDSFAKNSFFKPISAQAFQALYVPLLTAIDPRFVLMAKTQSGQICGFLFGFPDQSAPADNPTIILKTYASGVRGVGFALADHFHRAALNAGFKSVIHALMHEKNISLERSRQHKAVTFRRYALLARIM